MHENKSIHLSIQIFLIVTISEYYDEITSGNEVSALKNKFRFFNDVIIFLYSSKGDSLNLPKH